MSKALKRTLIIVCCTVSAALILLALIYFKIIHLNSLFVGKNDVKGVDVSSYQGEINWQRLASQEITFAYIKATEGSSQVDERFEYNFENVSQTGLVYGAYHFFSFDSSGEQQAKHFIATVPKREGMLAPVIDIEYYGDYADHPKDKDEVVMQAKQMADILEQHYGIKPVIYTTGSCYDRYVRSSSLEKYPLWIRNVYFRPLFAGKPVFWQYADDKKLEGYKGEEEHIDMNVFFGDKEKLKDYTIK